MSTVPFLGNTGVVFSGAAVSGGRRSPAPVLASPFTLVSLRLQRTLIIFPLQLPKDRNSDNVYDYTFSATGFAAPSVFEAVCPYLTSQPLTDLNTESDEGKHTHTVKDAHSALYERQVRKAAFRSVKSIGHLKST